MGHHSPHLSDYDFLLKWVCFIGTGLRDLFHRHTITRGHEFYTYLASARGTHGVPN